jgi:monooxygenase
MSKENAPNREHIDVLVVGAGLSGIGAGYHLQSKCPQKKYIILEGRDAIGGTWDLFRYPGIRSDSDMFTLGYSFRPWTAQKAIADGSDIRNYVCETAQMYGIDRHIRFGHHVKGASWSSKENRWTVLAFDKNKEQDIEFTCNFLFVCSGYYDYEQGYTPDYPGLNDFQGQFIHPQRWDENLVYEGKRVVVIGSGATAVTLVPSLADKAAMVTMLQRSPTYIVSRPAGDAAADWLRARLPAQTAYNITRWKNVVLGMAVYQYCRRFPQQARTFITKQVQAALGPDYDIQTHFTPKYDPWDERLCLVPDGDLFRAIKQGRAQVVTDHIKKFTQTGIELQSGNHLDADIIVSATGLKLLLLGGMNVVVDGKPIDPSHTLNYRGTMFSDIPNLAMSFGYTNASWTLKCDLICEYVCRLLNHMDQHGYKKCVPRRNDPTVEEKPLVNFTSGYFQRAMSQLPKQGSKAPWKLYENYFLDIFGLKFNKVEDGVLELSRT